MYLNGICYVVLNINLARFTCPTTLKTGYDLNQNVLVLFVSDLASWLQRYDTSSKNRCRSAPFPIRHFIYKKRG